MTGNRERGPQKRPGRKRGEVQKKARARRVHVREIDSLREELERRTAGLTPARWNADP